jgi:hypothetical protein
MDRNSRLYDFEKKELDTNRYQTFFEYFTRKGLKFNNTLLYLCTLTGEFKPFSFCIIIFVDR